jgi:hypothetical protein
MRNAYSKNELERHITQARKETFVNTAKLTVAKEKGVCWSPHEPVAAMPQPNNSMAPADTLEEMCDGTIPKAP